eukprot:GCRY01001096.1.p1 GENE.GCRY01001096.1~~GCRY01001096.1.p1  ORF type:complete len:205 (-),score=25.52 GCRY01001096.1:93-707(-)
MTRLLFFVLFLVPLVNAQLSIPKSYDGHAIGNGPLLFEMYGDLACSSCAATWPILQQILPEYEDKVTFILHTFPLPYHTFAFMATQAALAVEKYNSSLYFPFATALFQNQDLYVGGFDSAIYMLSSQDVVQILEKIGGSVGVPSHIIQNGLKDNSLNGEVRFSFKFAATRGVFYTPTFDLNGVRMDPNTIPTTLAEWRKVLDAL